MDCERLKVSPTFDANYYRKRGYFSPDRFDVKKIH